MDSLTIAIPKKIKKQKKQVIHNLDGFVEIKKEHIKHLHGSWLKYMCKKTSKLYTGGFLDKIEKDMVFLRCPSKDNLVVDINTCQFFIKEKNENYLALQDLIISHQKEMHTLVNYKKKIIKMINDGEIKFIK